MSAVPLLLIVAVVGGIFGYRSKRYRVSLAVMAVCAAGAVTIEVANAARAAAIAAVLISAVGVVEFILIGAFYFRDVRGARTAARTSFATWDRVYNETLSAYGEAEMTHRALFDRYPNGHLKEFLDVMYVPEEFRPAAAAEDASEAAVQAYTDAVADVKHAWRFMAGDLEGAPDATGSVMVRPAVVACTVSVGLDAPVVTGAPEHAIGTTPTGYNGGCEDCAEQPVCCRHPIYPEYVVERARVTSAARYAVERARQQWRHDGRLDEYRRKS